MATTDLLNRHQRKLHFLAQYLGAFGKSYLPAVEDHSHTALYWSIARSRLRSASLDNTFLALDHTGLTLRVCHKEKERVLDVIGAAKSDIVSWIRETLEACDLDPSQYTTDMGYRLPFEPDYFLSLTNEDEKVLMRLTGHRSLAQKALEEIRENAPENTSPIRVWPHHFDTGMLYYPEPAQKEKGIGLGYTPADKICSSPYYYVYSFGYDQTERSLPALQNARWITGQWTGAIIPTEEAPDLAVINQFYGDYLKSVIEN